MVYKCILKKVKVDHNRLSEDSYEGLCSDLPFIGKQFFLQLDTLRWVQTSEVVGLWKVVGLYKEGDTYDLLTKSGSHYQVVVLEEITNG